MTERQYRLWFGIILLVGLAIRLASVPPFGFFGDVPYAIHAIETKAYVFHFPGYGPFHLLIGAIASTGIPIFASLSLFSLVCSTAAWIYIMRAAQRAAGREVSLVTGVVGAFGVFFIYFATMGTSYVTDMLFISAALYYGWGFIRDEKEEQYYAVLAWLCFDIIMRPLSALTCVPGIIYLFYRRPGWRAFWITTSALGLTMVAFVAISIPLYGSLADFVRASRNLPVADAAAKPWLLAATNLFRVAFYPLFAFHIWIVLAALIVWRYRGKGLGPALKFLLCLTGPYFLLLVNYIPGAGYYCLLLPAIVLLPVCVISGETFSRATLAGIAASFAVISLCQWFLLAPVPVTNVRTGVEDAYFLQYSRAAVKKGYAETLSSLMYKSHMNVDQIPAARMQQLRNGIK